MFENNDDILYLLKDIELYITFPYVTVHHKDSLCIYQETLRDITDSSEKTLLLHLGSDESELYNINVDKLLCSKDSNIDELWYPSISLYHNGNKLLFPDISPFVLIRNKKIFFESNSSSIDLNKSSYTYDEYKEPVYKLDQMKIKIKCDIEVIYISDEPKELSSSI